MVVTMCCCCCLYHRRTRGKQKHNMPTLLPSYMMIPVGNQQVVLVLTAGATLLLLYVHAGGTVLILYVHIYYCLATFQKQLRTRGLSSYASNCSQFQEVGGEIIRNREILVNTRIGGNSFFISRRGRGLVLINTHIKKILCLKKR